MKKVIAFLLTAALALGGIAFAHAAVTDSQDELVIYPIAQAGDAAAVEGLTAGITFACGDHLRWHTDYHFGGGSETRFEYSPKAQTQVSTGPEGRMSLWLSGGIGSSTSGTFSLNTTDYGAMLRAVAALTPDGGSKTMNLRMADYVTYYMPEYELYYRNGESYCSQRVNLHELMAGDDWHEDNGAYYDLMAAFRFPVQSDHIMAVGVSKNDAGGVNSIDMTPENGPELNFISDVDHQGLWFVPIFRDETGTPLAYDSPEGHGIYHIPWKEDSSVTYGGYDRSLTPDVDNARRVIPLDETVPILDLVIDAGAQEAWLLTLEEGTVILTAYDLSSGTVRSRTPVLAWDSGSAAPYADFVRDEGFLLLTVQEHIALVDGTTGELLLTAPDVTLQTYSADNYDPNRGDLRFDGETLILLDTGYFRHGAFWTAVYRQGAQVFYGLYDCSLLRGNDDWYYSYITTEQDPVTLK